ncbi:hypothetical protein [Citrobacter portucalensis]|uniref:hypothetical protein n=1 Tax=Citrobacter portucalensis TaxID=1639133 RepID=UPI0002412E81|nr:hypothetical protein [Citrobacter portucalensis]EHL80929.1 hypothetical protein HMPREF9428_01631 [Citrobacter portucalensis]
MNFYYTAEFNSFISEKYKTDGTYTNKSWPADAVLCTDDEVRLYRGMTPPEGKQLGSELGRPVWIDIATPPNDVLLSNEISKLGIAYKQDIADLNTAYLAAIVSDGPSEITKQQVVRDQITKRKEQYVADIATAKEKYPI